MKSIKIITDVTYFDKELVKYYPNMTLLEVVTLKNMITNVNYNNISDIKTEFNKQIPLIYDMIDWDLYREIILIESYFEHTKNKTGLNGIESLQKLCENVSYQDYKKLLDIIADKHYPAMAKEFKKHFSEELLKYKNYLQREKKLKRII